MEIYMSVRKYNSIVIVGRNFHGEGYQAVASI